MTDLHDLPDDIRSIIENLKSLKELTVASDDAMNDLCPMVEAYVDGKRLATVCAPELNRDMGLWAARLCIRGFGADAIWFMSDAHGTNRLDNPYTGKPWEPGDMQRACEMDMACELGVITDTLMVFYRSREGAAWFVNIPYHVHKADNTVHWVDEELIYTQADTISGFVPNFIAEEFTHPCLINEVQDAGVKIEDFELSPRIAAIHINCVIIKQLLEQGFSVTLVEPEEEDERLVYGRSLNGYQVDRIVANELILSKH